MNYKTCAFDECDGPAYCKGWCQAHYWQSKSGKAMRPVRRRFDPTKPPCSFEGCSRIAHYGSLCQGHTAQERRGETLRPIHEPQGWTQTATGYIARRVQIDGKREFQLQHRLVMEGILKRKLLPGETVHHKNGVRTDNRPENLELWVSSQPAGQRPEDLIVWAKEILARYDPLIGES